MPLPIRIREGPEPFSRRARTESILLAESDAFRILFRELERYVDGAVGGRSFLISGHRGSGKTTLVLQAVQKLEIRRRSAPDGSMPLLVRLRGPELLPERPEDVADPSQATKEKAPEPTPPAKGGEGKPAPADAAGRSESPGAEGKGGAGGGDAQPVSAEGAEAPKASDIPSARLAEHVLIQITQAIYRALASRFADALDHRIELDERSGRVPPWLLAERRELASQLRLALDQAPGPAQLRELWRRAGLLENGVLATDTHGTSGRGYRELVALASAAQAYRVVSGTFEEKRSGGASLEQELSRETGASLAVKDAGRQLLALFAGGATAAGLFLQGASGLLGGLAAAAVAVAVSWSLKLAGKRTAKRSVSEEYSFLRDHSVSTLERELPVLVERLHQAGLAPVVMVDELDKVDLLPDRMEQVVDRLKHFVTEGAFFCFLTDRDYFEHLRDLALREPYPREYTYFTDRLLVLYRPRDLHEYLGTVLEPLSGTNLPGLPGSTDLEVLPYVLLHRARMHPVDLRRELVKLRGEGNQVALKPGEVVSALAYRYAVLIQLAVEALLARKDLAERLEQDPNFGQPVYDALYYPSRRWAEGKRTLDVSSKAFREYLTERMTPNRPRQGRRNRTEDRRSAASGHGAGDPELPEDVPELPLSEQDVEFLHAQVRELVALLLAPHLLVQELNTTDPDRTISSAAVQTIPADPGDPLLEEVEPELYRWRFGPYGRKLLPVPVERPKTREAPAETTTDRGKQKTTRARTEALAPDQELAVPGVPEPNPTATFEEQLAAAGIDLRKLRPNEEFLRFLNENVIEVTGRFDLQRLADELFILARSPSWMQVRDALDRLRQLELHGEVYPEMEQDAGLIGQYLEMLKQRGLALAASFELAGRISRASPHEVAAERLADGLVALSVVLRFREMRTVGEITDALWPLESQALAGEVVPSLEPDRFSSWWEAVAGWVVWDRESREVLAQVQVAAWKEWHDRLHRFVLTQDPRFAPQSEDLECQVAGIPPTILFEFELRRMTLAQWSRLAELSLGIELLIHPVGEISELGPSHTPPWVVAPALAQLGLGSLLVGLGGLGTLFEKGRAGSVQWEEIHEWSRWVSDRQPSWVKPRPTALILAPFGGTVTEEWHPSTRFGAWWTRQPETVEVIWAALSHSSVPEKDLPCSRVVLVEIPSEKLDGEVLGLISRWAPTRPVVVVVQEAPPTNVQLPAPLVIGPKSFDDAMEQALKLVGTGP